jgi:CHAT domain-containing protein/pimeloyl-ACP methyl ester carboxylesterase
MADAVTLKLRGAPLPPERLPRAFENSQRSAAPAQDDPFLPRGLIRVDQAFDLSTSARASEPGRTKRAVPSTDGQVVVMELPEGVTVITHPENLREAVRRVDPSAIDADGAIVFDAALRERGAAMRGSVGDAMSEGLNSIVSQIYTLTVGHAADPIIDAAKRRACEWLGEKAEDKIEQYADLGVSWIGTKALMWAIESRLKRDPGLYRWVNAELTERYEPGDPRLAALAPAGPFLVMIHGTGSSTGGSFDALQGASPAYWRNFEDRYGERVLAFEHRTLSESPVDNALQLARALPEGAKLHLVSHSRGGLVGDLMCLDGFEELIDGYALDNPQLGIADPAERERIRAELVRVHADQRSALHELAAELKRKKIRVERYVRVASPARGTRLASGNFDVFLSSLLSLMGWVPALKGNPVYSAFKRVVLEIAKNRTRPNLVPGIEAMLPGSPMARFLARAKPQDGIKLAVISGDIEGGGWLKRLGVLFTDFTFFGNVDNDLVVDTDAMTAGVARPENTRVLFDQGPDVNHFRYFTNDATRNALRAWLLEASVDAVEAFHPLRGVDASAPLVARSRGAGTVAAAVMPVTVFLPGIMGSHLSLGGRERVWFDIASLALGGLARLLPVGGKKDSVQAEALFAQFYGDLQKYLGTSQRVVPFPYDWRLSLDVLADRLAVVLREQLDATASPLQPVRLLAHSMGGLVVRALIHKHPALWDELMARDGARLVMLGTPNQGSHLMVEALIGKSDTVRKLGVLDTAHDLQQVVDIIGSFPGALQLLPKPGFKDTGNDSTLEYFDPATWGAFKKDMRDFWFGDGIGALPPADLLKQGQWLWTQDRRVPPALPARHEKKVAYVFGCAAKTPCGIVRDGDRWKMLGTPHGDGSVTWDSGRIEGIGQFFYMPAEHGALADTEDYFESIASLIDHGEGGQLMTVPPAVRGAEQAPLVAPYDAGPAPYPTDAEAAAGLFGAGKRVRSRARRQDVLNVRVHAMDLRQVTQPILVGHYERDAISGPEALIDKHLVHGELTIRHHLGLYAGAVGTASAVMLHSSAQERQRGSMRGAVVAGLGPYDGSLTVGRLTESLRTACLRYLVHVMDSGAVAAGVERAENMKLASLLIGYNSSANLTIADSVQALIRATVEANQHFAQTTGSKLRIACLEIVEVYLDSAITATYAAREIAQTMNADKRMPCRIVVDPLLHQGEGMRQRLFDGRGNSYWPRLMITDADRQDGDCVPAPAPGTVTSPQRAALASRLHYLYVGQRARAESVVQQRQPGLVEKLVERQVMSMVYDADFSRTLFQLLVPHDFKDAARQMQQMVFVLDSYTANFPWELMLADDQPLATRTAMVRQLTSTRFRNLVNQTMERRAYVVGNPSTAGFFANFPDPQVREQDSLDDLPAAEKEATTVTDSLARHGFEVERTIGSHQPALEVVNRLYKHPYRIVHIAGHGMYTENADGTARSGVVLSDGLMITAAEIDAMEVVPDLVFLNCCHLGRIDRSPVAFNKLAYSIARQLIDIGVRAVVVAGWAVEDAAASLFAETFYEKLLADNLAFGEAVFKARATTWEQYPASITWGAYQAYGDPGWRADPKSEIALSRLQTSWGGVSPEELLDRLESEKQVIQRSGETISGSEAQRVADRVQQWLAATPPEWAARPDLWSAAADVYGDLGPGFFDKAREHYLRAIAAADEDGRVPLRAIEQLGNVETRLGEDSDDADMVAQGIARLESLVRLTGGVVPSDVGPSANAALPGSAERSPLLGSAYKRKAAVHAHAYLGKSGKLADFRAMRQALARSSAAYEAMASKLEDKIIRPYPTLNWLFLWSLTARAQDRKAYLAHVQRCAAAANAAFADDPEAYNSTMVPDAALLTALLNDSLIDAAQDSRATLDALVAAYEDALETSLVTPKERDTVVKQIRKMALFHRAYEKHNKVPPAQSVGARIEMLANRLTLLMPSDDNAPPPDETSMEVAGRVSEPAKKKAAGAKAGRKAAPGKKVPSRSARIKR